MNEFSFSYIINKLSDPLLDIIELGETISLQNLEKLILYIADKYYNTSETLISDEEYDLLLDILKKRKPKSSILKNIGSQIISKNKIRLDYWLGSMNKLKSTNINELNIWIKKYIPPYNISDKLDGVSALLIYNNNNVYLFTRGDGNYGINITYILRYIYIPTYNNIIEYCNKHSIHGTKNLIAFRGELIMNKDLFDRKWIKYFKNGRSAISGLVNSKKINIDLAKDTSLVLYEIIDPLFTINKQFKIITELNFNLVYNITIDTNINFNYLSNFLKNRRDKSIYQIDGIIITSTDKYIRNADGNPDYAFAYKDILEDQIAQTIIESIEWNISKDGFIIPTIIVQPVKIGGVIIKRVTGFNAKYITDNKLGYGAEIELIRSGDVIPHIKKIIKISNTGKPDLPKIKWHWSESKVDIIINDLDSNIDLKIKNIYHFFSVLKIKGLGQQNIKKIYLAGFNTIEKILKMSKENFLSINNFGEKLANNLLNAIHNSIKNVSLTKLMVGSNKLGHGLGEKKINEIIKKYPNILTEYKKWSNKEFINKLNELNGWNDKSSLLFVNNFNKFIKFMNSIKSFISFEQKSNISTKTIFLNKIIVLSGFRDEDLQNKLEKLGGIISETISKYVSYLVIKDKNLLNDPTRKIIKAQKYNIPIITKEELLYKLNS